MTVVVVTWTGASALTLVTRIWALLVVVWAYLSPVSSLPALVTVSRLLVRVLASIETGFQLDEVENLSASDRRVVADGHVSVGSRGRLGISYVSGRWPLLSIEEGTVRILRLSANVLVSDFEFDHVLVRSRLLFKSDVQESLFELLLLCGSE